MPGTANVVVRRACARSAVTTSRVVVAASVEPALDPGRRGAARARGDRELVDAVARGDSDRGAARAGARSCGSRRRRRCSAEPTAIRPPPIHATAVLPCGRAVASIACGWAPAPARRWVAHRPELPVCAIQTPRSVAMAASIRCPSADELPGGRPGEAADQPLRRAEPPRGRQADNAGRAAARLPRRAVTDQQLEAAAEPGEPEDLVRAGDLPWRPRAAGRAAPDRERRGGRRVVLVLHREADPGRAAPGENASCGPTMSSDTGGANWTGPLQPARAGPACTPPSAGQRGTLEPRPSEDLAAAMRDPQPGEKSGQQPEHDAYRDDRAIDPRRTACTRRRRSGSRPRRTLRSRWPTDRSRDPEESMVRAAGGSGSRHRRLRSKVERDR